MTNSIFTTKTAKKHGFNRKKRKDLIFYCCLLFLPILQFCVFYIGVNANSLLLAFKDYSDGPAKFVGFDNFERLFYDFKNYMQEDVINKLNDEELNFMVTNKEIDEMTNMMADIISKSINTSIHNLEFYEKKK